MCVHVNMDTILKHPVFNPASFLRRFIFPSVCQHLSLCLALLDLQPDEVRQLYPLPQIAAVPGVHVG